LVVVYTSDLPPPLVFN